MVGIPSAVDARRLVVRVLLRAALLAGMVVAGWLLGSATGLAQESWIPHDRTPHHQATPEPEQAPQRAGFTSLADAPTPADINVDTPEPAIQTPPLPLQPVALPVAALPVATVVPEPALEPVLDPILDPIKHTVTPEPVAVESLASGTATELAGSLPPADPAGATAEAVVGPLSPPVTASSQAAAGIPTLESTAAAESAGNRFAGSSPADLPVSPIPQRPSGTTTTFCLATSASSHATTQSAHAVTLNDGSPETNHALLHHRRYQQADGVPGSLNQQPSTSPD